MRVCLSDWFDVNLIVLSFIMNKIKSALELLVNPNEDLVTGFYFDVL